MHGVGRVNMEIIWLLSKMENLNDLRENAFFIPKGIYSKTADFFDGFSQSYLSSNVRLKVF